MSAVCTESATDPYAGLDPGQTEARRAHALMINRRTGRGARTRQPEGASQQATEDRRLVSRRACVFAPTRRGKAPARGLSPRRGPDATPSLVKRGHEWRAGLFEVAYKPGRVGCQAKGFFALSFFLSDCSRSRINQVVWDVRQPFRPFFFSVTTTLRTELGRPCPVGMVNPCVQLYMKRSKAVKKRKLEARGFDPLTLHMRSVRSTD